MPVVDLQRVARVVAVHAVGRDQDRAVDAHLVHCGDHLIASHFRWSVEKTDPRPLGTVALVGVDLGVDHRRFHGRRMIQVPDPVFCGDDYA